jgi:hypothetical protein
MISFYSLSAKPLIYQGKNGIDTVSQKRYSSAASKKKAEREK